MARLELRNLTKRYGAVDAIADVSVDVADGELLVLLGPSGSGKSTILKVVAGIETADSGEIWIGDERVDTLLPRSRDVAMVFQSYALYPHMSVFSNLAFPLRSARMARAEVGERVREVAELLSLEGLLERRPGQLSGGQQQRVALGRAIVRRPKVFLMDEPLSNLDAKLRARTRLELVRLHERLRATTVYVTHDQVEAMTMGDRVAVLDGGVLRQVDVPEVVYEHPADLVVADFVGSPPMNVVPGLWRSEERTATFVGQGIELSFPLPVLDAELRAGAAAPGSEVILGVRPEYLRIGHDLPAGQTLAALVERVELLGSDRLVYVVVGAARLAVRVPASVRPSPGQTVPVGVDGAGVRLFDAVTGKIVSRGCRPAPPGSRSSSSEIEADDRVVPRGRGSASRSDRPAYDDME